MVVPTEKGWDGRGGEDVGLRKRGDERGRRERMGCRMMKGRGWESEEREEGETVGIPPLDSICIDQLKFRPFVI